MNSMIKLNFNIKFTSESSLKDLKYISKEEVNLSSYLQKLLTNKQTASNIKVSSPYTNQLLKQLNFNWSNINTNYFKHGLEENLK